MKAVIGAKVKVYDRGAVRYGFIHKFRNYLGEPCVEIVFSPFSSCKSYELYHSMQCEVIPGSLEEEESKLNEVRRSKIKSEKSKKDKPKTTGATKKRSR